MLKSLAVLLLLPPVNLALLAAAGLGLARWRPRLGWWIASVSVAGLILLSLPAVTAPMIAALEQDLPTTPPAAAPPQAIIILGGDAVASRSVPGGFTLGGLTLARLRSGAALHRRTGLPILVSGGRVPREAPPLAELMARSLREDFGVTARWMESRSADTFENAAFSAPVLRDAGITSVYVVTHGWHMRRALLAFAPTGLTVTAAPTPLQRPLHLTAGDFLPSITSWLAAYYAAHETVGLVWYSLR